MENYDGWLKVDELVHQIGEENLSIWQIQAWRKKGLIQSPYRHYLGIGKGTESLYPPDTVDQIRLIIKLQRENHIRRLSDIQTWLWIEGFPIDGSQIKENLQSLTIGLQRFTVNDPQEIPGRVDELLKNPHTRKYYSGFTHKSEEEIKGVLAVLISLSSGLPIVFDLESSNSDYAIGVQLEKLMDIEKARENGLPKTEPWLSGLPGDYLPALSKIKLLSIPEAQKAIANISNEDLEKVRTNLKLLIDTLPYLKEFLGIFTRRFGLSSIKKTVYWGKKNITFILLAFVTIEYHDLNLYSLLSDLKSVSEKFRIFDNLDDDLKKRVTRDLRRKVDRNKK